MEIVTFVRQGAITHRDHLGNEGRTEAGDVQAMTAGKGILHAEYNFEAEPTRIFQISPWPLRSELKYTMRLSRDQPGRPSGPGYRVSRCGTPPEGAMT